MSLARPVPASSRVGVLARLAKTLDGFGQRLARQGERLRSAAALAPRAEEAALRARMLAFGCGGSAAPVATALASELGTLAAETAALAARAEAAAAAGEDATSTLTGQAAALAALIADPEAPPDGSVLRRILTPLANRLESLPVVRAEEGSIGLGLARIAEQARPLAERAGTIAAQDGTAAREEALRLSRDLGLLAAEAGQLAAAITAEARQPDAVAEAVTGSLLGMTPPPPPPRPAPVPVRPFGKVVWTGVGRLR